MIKNLQTSHITIPWYIGDETDMKLTWFFSKDIKGIRYAVTCCRQAPVLTIWETVKSLTQAFFLSTEMLKSWFTYTEVKAYIFENYIQNIYKS